MSSLLAYGQGFLAGDIGSGAGLTEPWAQSFGWGGDGSEEESSQNQASEAAESDAFQAFGGEGGGLSQFYSVIQAGAPREATDSPNLLSRSSTKKDLHWDSPPQSPSTVFVHLPYSVLTIVSTGTKTDAVVVGVFQHGSESVVEPLLYLPRGLSFAEYLSFKPELLGCINGKIFSTDKLYLPPEFTTALGERPQAFLAQRFCLEKYNGIIFGLWRDGSKVPATAEAVFADAVQSLPMLLSNRINARKYERLGRRFDAILKVMPDAVLFVDDEFAQVVLNPAAAVLLGLPHHGEVDPSKVAEAMRTLTNRCSGRTDPQHWMRLLSTDEEMEIEEDWELKMPRRVLHVRSYPVTSHAAHGRLWIYEDVTAERDAEEAIETANRAKSQFLAMMSHELRTPMTGVLGMLDLLHLTNLGLEQQGLVKIMQESAENLMDVINNILDFCKIEAGRLQLEEIDFALDDMFQQIQSMLKTSSLKEELKLTISGEPYGRNVVRGDPVRLRQVLLNLVSNAIKFTDNGRIDISWRFLDPQWVDTTVVATSQSSSGKSKLINQIINASRGEKCSVEHLTTAAGRSVIVVNCSSAGAAGPYLESSTSSKSPLRPSAPFSPFQESQPVATSSSMGSNATESLPQQSTTTRQPSFPVLYAHQPEKRAVPEAFQNAETIHSFTERKSIVTQSSDPIETLTSSSDAVSQTQTSRSISDEDQTPPPPFSQKPLVKDATSGSAEEAFRASKYQRLSVDKSSNNNNNNNLEGSSSSLADKRLYSQLNDNPVGMDSNPKWRSPFHAAPPPVSIESTVTSIPLRVGGNNVITDGKGREEFARKQGMLVLRPHEQRVGAMPSTESQDKSGAGEAKVSGATTEGLQFCEGNEGVLYLENRKSKEVVKEVNPEDRVWLEVTISDTGVGIGKEQLDRLFVGSQAGSQRRNAAGTGLGLAICKGLLCLMNGKIQIDSKIGEGTTVILTVPLLPAEEAVQELIDSASVTESAPAVESAVVIESAPPVRPLTTPEPPPSKPVVVETKSNESYRKDMKILVAEDNRVNQLLIRKMFKHLGIEVEVVGNGKLALEAVQRTVFDVVLMDVQMPILDGLSATKAIRGLTPPTSQIPIYALSADTPGSGPLEETGLDGYLKKPIAWEVLSQLLDQILAAKIGL